MSARGLLLSFGLACVWLAGGTVYGWTPLEAVLKDEGVYDSYPPHTRNSKLEVIVNVGLVVTNLGGIAAGFILDFLGPGVTNAVALAVFVAGCLTFGFGWSLVFGYALLGFAGSCTFASGFRLGGLYPEYTPVVMSAVSCLFDSSTIVFFVFQVLNKSAGASVKAMFIGVAAAVALVQVPTVVMWYLRLKDSEDNVKQPLLKAPAAKAETLHSKPVLRGFKHQGGEEEEEEVGLMEAQPAPAGMLPMLGDEPQRRGSIARSVRSQAESVMSYAASVVSTAEGAAHHPDMDQTADGDPFDTRVPITDRPIGRQASSAEYIFILLFATVNMYRTTWYLSATEPFLDSIGDEAKHRYALAVGVIVPCGAAFMPVVGWLLQTKGLWWGTVVTSVAGVLHGALQCFPNLNVQLATAVVFTFYRALLFSTVYSFIARVFGRGSVGRLAGFLRATVSLLVLTQQPLTTFVGDHLGGSYKWPHIVSVCVMPLSFVLCGWVLYASEEIDLLKLPKRKPGVNNFGSLQ